MTTTVLLAALAVINLVGGVCLVRYSRSRERRRPEAVLVVGVLLVLTALFLVSVAVRVHTQQEFRQQLDRTRPVRGPGRAGTAASRYKGFARTRPDPVGVPA